MTAQLELGDISIDVTFKDIKNVHLSVLPPSGRVRIAAPARMNLESIRLFAVSKLEWIKRQQRKLREQERETHREYLDRESHYFWGKRYLLTVVEEDRVPFVEISHNRIFLHARPKMNEESKYAIFSAWYREQIKAFVPVLIATWGPIIGAVPEKIHVRKMKTKWGSCNPNLRSIRLNTELAKKPKESLEYVLVHEMIHLLVPTHNAYFIECMDRFLPDWRLRRTALNELPVCHEAWKEGESA